jgi:probable DNA repair protein
MDSNAGCLAHLDAGGLVLTADLRQARILRRLHDRAQIAAGRGAWPTAQVLPLGAWLARQWAEAAAEQDAWPVLLAPVALRWMWRRLCAQDAPELPNAGELAARARASWLALRAHGGNSEVLARWPMTRDHQAFHAWARAAERELAERNACDPEDLARELVSRGTLPEPGAPILLVGFDRPTPAEAALIEALARRGWSVGRHEARATGAATSRHAAADPDAERTDAIAWLRSRLAERPEGVHALIAPTLAADRGPIERALEAALQPALELPGTVSPRVFDLAGGRPLFAWTVVEIALDILHGALGGMDWAVATRILRSADLAASAAERESCARLDVALRRPGRAWPSDLQALARELRFAGAVGFAAALEAAGARFRGARRRSAGAWAEAFGACLGACGWPREGLASADWQAAARLRELLRELARLEKVSGSLDGEQALAQLRELAAAPFQPESGEPAVIVIDRWDDPGLRLDSLWVSGLTAPAWPRPLRVDPFLPIEAQRMLRMPRATAADCVAEAQAALARWQSQASALVLSWPRRVDDTNVDASPLLPPHLPDAPAPVAASTRAELLRGATLERLEADPAPRLAAARVRGGARVLELQSACPFRAFGELRLAATPLEEPSAGIDRRLRGQVLHRALEIFWAGLGSQAALLVLDAAACEARIAEAVQAALAETVTNGAGPRTLELERDWQRRAVAGLVAIDRGRPPFTVVETEREMEGRIGGLELRLRVDRVDDAGGARVVIDYKTGRTRGAPWRGARMDAPQLPLYAVLQSSGPAAIAIAEAGSSGARFVGVGDAAAAFDGIVPAPKFKLTEDKESGFEWPVVTQRWWAWLDALARAHREGHAAVDPKLARNTCRRCHLGALCRVEDAGRDPEGDEGDGE